LFIITCIEKQCTRPLSPFLTYYDNRFLEKNFLKIIIVKLEVYYYSYRMLNSNDTFRLSNKTQEILWIVCVPTSILHATIILYGLLAVIVLYVNKNICCTKGSNNGKQTVLKTISLPDLSPRADFSGHVVSGSLTRNGSEVVGIYMHHVLLAAVISATLRIICEQLIIFYTKNCDVFAKINILLTGFSIHFCHWYLWLRQHIFFSNPVLRQYRPRIFTFFSFIWCPMMIIGFAVNTVVHMWYRKYTNFRNVCQGEDLKVEIYKPFVILAGTCTANQIFLTFLFIYPIMRHNSKMKACRIHQTCKIVSRDSARKTQRQLTSLKMKSALLSRLIKKAFVSCIIAIIVDCLAALSFIWIPQSIPACTLSTIYEFVVISNILCVIYTYPEWQNILFVCCNQQEFT